MSLKDRKKAAQEQNDKDQAARARTPDGEYHVVWKDWDFKKSRAGNDMYVMNWKIVKGELKGTTKQTYYVTSLAFHVTALLEIVEEMGADLEKLDDLKDLAKVFEKVEEGKPPQATLVAKNKDEKSQTNLSIKGVEKVLSAEVEGEDDDDDDGVMAPS